MALLIPNPTGDIIGQQKKRLDSLTALPKNRPITKAMVNVNFSTSRLDAVACLLIVKLTAGMNKNIRGVLWETMPYRFPDLTAHVPALITAVRDETQVSVLGRLSSHPLPTTLSPETAGWRAGLVVAWEKRLKEACDAFDGIRDLDRINECIFSLRGLIQVDKYGMSPGTTCPSVLPSLLNGARYVCEKFTGTELDFHRFECLSTLAGWRPAPNVIPDPAVLNEWADFWLELYQQEDRHIQKEEQNDSIILKGIAAKALLNLMETDGKEETEPLAGMAPSLLESLTGAVEVAGTPKLYPYVLSQLGWLSWQPREVTRFPHDRLAELPKTLLRRFSLLCQSHLQNPCRWEENDMQQVRKSFLTELVRWDRTGLLADCGIDLLRYVVPRMSGYLDNCLSNHVSSSSFLNAELCRWLFRDEVANVEEGRELLQKVESHLRFECNSKRECWPTRYIAWHRRVQLQQAGLATETSADFQENLLKAIKNEKDIIARVLLYFWRTEEYMPGNGYKETIIPLLLLRPDPADDIVTRRQKLWDVLCALPKESCPKLSIAEMTCLMGELPSGNLKADPSATPDRMWQFKPDEMRFRVPTTHVASVSTASTPIQNLPDRQYEPDRTRKPGR